MRKRHSNYRLVKIHRSYTVDEVARSLGVHKNTVRQWIKGGLQCVDDQRPKLIQGQYLRTFLQVRRASRKRPCGPGEMYCFRCRSPKLLAAGMLDYRALTDKIVNLMGICPDCEYVMHRCVSITKFDQFVGKTDITFPQALRRIGEISQLTVNSDLRGDVQQ